MSRHGGNVAVRTLLPLSTQTTRIGGTGYEYWVNNANYPPAGSIDTVHSTPGNWRLEVIPTQITDSLVFLHTIKIGDSITPSQAGGTGQINTFTAGVDWENTLFFFNARGDTGCSYQIQNHVHGGRNISIFAADLLAGRLFNVLVDHVVISTLLSDEHGILQSAGWLSSGDHTLEIEKKSGIVHVIESGALSDRLYSAFPDPANEYFNLEVLSKTGTGLDFTLYSQTGERIISGTTWQKEVINVKHLAAGTYWIEAHNSTERQVMKIIISH